MQLTQRQSALLQAIVQEYIKTAKPIGSKALVQEYGFDCSSATIRNEMAVLEQAGYIMQPHTSAGRIPSEAGYQYYIKHFLREKALSTRQRKTLDEVYAEQQHRLRERALAKKAKQHKEQEIMLQRELVKRAAKTIADLTGEAVIISVNGVGTYFTGMSHMFSKPEFSEHAEVMLRMGQAFDEIDELMLEISNLTQERAQLRAQKKAEQQAQKEEAEMERRLREGVDIFLGRENPFSEVCSMIVSDYPLLQGRTGTMSILGPMRMDYDTNISIVEYMDSLIDEEK